MSSRLLKNNCSNVGPAYAALDLGTNSCRMLIARADRNNLKIIDSFSKSVKLGSGLEESKKLSNGAMKRAISALKICQQKLNFHKVKKNAFDCNRGLPES